MGTFQGLGIDIIEIERLQKTLDRHGQHFLDRIFTEREQDYCLQHRHPAIHFSGHFAAKEAVAKCLGCGFGTDLTWHDIEILHDEKKKPTVSLSFQALEKFGKGQFFLSLSHTHTYAVAVAIWII
jgi:holo-[acyl-carrier protein] synthase